MQCFSSSSHKQQRFVVAFDMDEPFSNIHTGSSPVEETVQQHHRMN